ncbi:hypothetical protein K458DRAFT_391660 [Lentithecium fluviatile CBS 122367]|uniref:Uncharacterized protein n=1 Tax=Lentithecium fluviatile CBS 122367 TaxID=1168545 RepID=A0A6G1IUC7_9PLEO|nr:hypothetical protein K458DRAFT_391660 [Lentithecium fluviatile CBS 122367]
MAIREASTPRALPTPISGRSGLGRPHGRGAGEAVGRSAAQRRATSNRRADGGPPVQQHNGRLAGVEWRTREASATPTRQVVVAGSQQVWRGTHGSAGRRATGDWRAGQADDANGTATRMGCGRGVVRCWIRSMRTRAGALEAEGDLIQNTDNTGRTQGSSRCRPPGGAAARRVFTRGGMRARSTVAAACEGAVVRYIHIQHSTSKNALQEGSLRATASTSSAYPLPSLTLAPSSPAALHLLAGVKQHPGSRPAIPVP